MSLTMSNIRSVDMVFLCDIFDIRGGYALYLSDRRFACHPVALGQSRCCSTS